MSRYVLKKAADAGIIHIRLDKVKNSCVVSRCEIQKNLELIKKPKKGGRSEMEELIKKGIRGVNELERHGIPSSIIYRYYPRPVATDKMFYCMRFNTWVTTCKIECKMKEKCH